MNCFAERLRELRAIKGVTQVQLADDIAFSKGAIAMWETGKREPDFDTLIALSCYFGASVDSILGCGDYKAAQGKQPVTKFDIWKQPLTSECIVEGKFVALLCGGCPASGKTCINHDTACGGNFLILARAKAYSEEVISHGLPGENLRLQPQDRQTV